VLNDFIGEMLEGKVNFTKSIVSFLSFSCHVDSSDDPEYVKLFLGEKSALEAYNRA
jgi:hypothetical protein